MSKRKPKLQRERIIELVTREIRRMKQPHREKAVDDLIVNGLLWCTNSNLRTAEAMERALFALLAVASVDEFEHTAHMTFWHRELLKGAEDAEATARNILAPLGVRYAPCGCLEWAAGEDCCEDAMKARAA